MKANPSITSAGSKTIELLKELEGSHRVAVGLSGGVDSSLTAALLVEAGWEVEGLTLWLMSGKGACCTDGLVDASGICKQLDITHHIVDSRKTFQEEIVEGILEGYKKGITPLPCSRCNRNVKFSEMLNWAQSEKDIDRIATGHYARVRYSKDNDSHLNLPGESQSRTKLLRGVDTNKDQSYFLYDLPQEILSKVVFPLGEMTKSDTRSEAAKYNLRTANKPESQDLCLADHYGSMKAFIDAYLPSKIGEIVLEDGKKIGNHNGIQHFTIGQRKGLGVSWKEPLHVVEIDAANNKIIVAPRSRAGNFNCIVGSVNWISIEPPQEVIYAEVQIRYRSNPVMAEITPITPTEGDIKGERPNRCNIAFKDQQFSITPGQAAVFYYGEVVLGGGIIENN